jgi:outer membrane protein assembly factor BamD (BamD/ComL family)
MTRIQLSVPILCVYLLTWQMDLEGQAPLEQLTFKDALESCIAAAGSGDLATAADLFQSLDTNFGTEDEYRAAEAQQRILPLKGLAELGAGRFGQAATTLESLQKAFPEVLQNNASLLYGLAQAHRGAGNFEQAREALELYIKRFAGTVEANLAFLERADLFFQEGLIEEGLTAVDQFNSSEAPQSLKVQGQLKAIQATLDQGRTEEAMRRMLDTGWSVTTMPELAQLSFSALRCGEYAMSTMDYKNALRLFKLVPPKSQLIGLQQEKIKELNTRILSGRQRALLSSNRHQQNYLTSLQQKLTQQLEALELSEDYTPMFYLHYGQCLLFDAQFYKAWLVFEYLSLNEEYPQEVREEAHYRWVVCAHQLADWEEALTIARNFVDRYPDSKLAPQALYLIAKAHLEQRRYPESNEVLTDLIEKFTKHPLHGRWLFTRGFNFVVLQDYEKARGDFEQYNLSSPQGQLIVNVRLWKALTHFFEKNYPTCIEQLQELATMDFRHPLYPEILYRLASAQYSAREHDLALVTIDDYLERFPRHQRIEEARVLKGDILMGQGELGDAVVSFKAVSAEAPDLYLYSLFQVGKILRAQEDYDGMVTHFQSFLENNDLPRLRVSEALYWLGWAYQQQDRVDLAYPVYEDALKQYGDDLEAGETQSILQALERLKKRQGNIPTHYKSSLVGSPDFESWLDSEITKAEKTGTLTYLSRLVLYQNQRYPKSMEASQSLISLAAKVSMEKLDPDALGKVGLALL